MGAGVFIYWSPSLVGQLLTPRQSPRRLNGSPLQPPCQTEALQPLRHEVVSRKGQQEGAVWMLHMAWAAQGWHPFHGPITSGLWSGPLLLVSLLVSLS